MGKFQSCSCCPYGYHIDLDFVRFCEALSLNSGNRPDQDGDAASRQRRRERRQRRERRLQRQSMEVLLGLAPLPVPEVKNEYLSSMKSGASVQVQNDLQKAVLDFEEILQRSSSRQNNISPAAHLYSFHSDAESPDIGGSIIKPNHLSLSDINEVDPRTIHDEDEDYRLSPGSASEMAPLGGGPPDDTASVTSNTSAGALQTIREQMAVSLERMKDLEEQVKAIPVLQVQLSVLKEEKRQLLMQLKSAEDFSKPKLYSNKSKTASIMGSRDVGVITCSVVTRDVGITHSQPKVRSVSTQANATNILAPPETKIEMNTASTETDLSMPNVYSEKELDQNIAKAIKMYEQTFYHLLHPKKKEKPVVDTIGTQTCPVDSDMLRIIERRDIAVQTASDNHYKDVGVTAKSRTADVGINAVVRTRHFGCSDNTINRLPCDKCSVKKISVGVGTLTSDNDINNDRIPVSLNSLSVIRSKSFDYTEKPFGFMKKKYGMRSVGCSTIAKVTSSKYTSTNDHNDFIHKDVGVNTMKRKLVDAAVGDSVRLSDDNIKICDKCGVAIKTAAKDILHLHSPTKVEHGVTVSRIPRPTTTPIGAVSLPTVPTNPDKRKFKRQDTYTKLYANDTSVEFSDSTGEKIDMFTLKTSSSSEEEGAGSKQTDAITNDYAQEEHVSVSEAALFQPIRNEPRQKAEPNKEMRAALKVLNDSLQKSPVGGSLPHHLMKNANDIVQQDWFKISSTASANPLDVEDYLDCFEEISSQLLEYIVNMTDISGNTAMHYALSHGNFDVVSILLDSKVCNINHANAAGYTCVMLVSLAHVTCETHRQVVRRLFQMADVNIRAKQHGQTALMLAVSHGRLETVQLLLECGADVNIQDDDGSTALMCAAEHGHIEIVKLLFSQPDCDLTITDYDGSTALNIAMEAGYRDIGLLLYAQEHFSRGNSPYPSLKQRRAKSVTPTPTSTSHNSLKGLPKHQHQDNSF